MLVKLVRILLGFVVAGLLAGAVQVLFVMTPADLAEADADTRNAAGLLALLTATQTAVFAAPFALVAILTGEILRVRSAAYYALVAIAIAVAGFALQYMGDGVAAPTIANSYALTAYATAGFVGGLAYWFVAGRGAGRAREAA